jgi:ATP-dependent Clp protease, protease subunit
MKFEAKDGEATIWIYDAIGEMFGPDAVTAKGVRDRLQSLRGVDKLNIRINSPGGMVDDAVAIHTLLSEYKAEKVTKIDGVAASAATILIPRDSKVSIAQGAKMMIHNPWSVAVGDWREMEKAAKVAKQYATSAAEMYAARTGKPMAEVVAAMEAETYFLGEEAVAWGLADDMGDGEAVAAATVDGVMAQAMIVARLAFAALVGQTTEKIDQACDAMAAAARKMVSHDPMRLQVALARARQSK